MAGEADEVTPSIGHSNDRVPDDELVLAEHIARLSSVSGTLRIRVDKLISRLFSDEAEASRLRELARITAVKYRNTNANRIRQYARLYRRLNAEKISYQKAARYQLHRDAVVARVAKHRSDNVDSIRAAARRRYQEDRASLSDRVWGQIEHAHRGGK